MSYSTNERMWYEKNIVASPERDNFIRQRGHTTSIIPKKGKSLMSHSDQLRTIIEEKDVMMEGDLDREGRMSSSD